MAFTTWSSSVDHTTDADFRAWGLDISNRLTNTSSLLTKTSDTGQIDWVTVTRSSANTDAGFEMYELIDALSATAPVFFKIWYGTNSGPTEPRIKIEIGVETDGSGNFVGPTSGTRIVATRSTSTSVATSYLSINEGFVGLVWQFGLVSSTKALGGFMISRTSTAAGTMSPDGILAFGDSVSVSTTVEARKVQARVLPANTISFLGGWGPSNDTSSFLAPSPLFDKTSFDGLAPQALIGWAGIPEIHPVLNLAIVNRSEIGSAATFSVALAGSTPRTYINMDVQLGPVASAANPTISVNYGLCMIWD